MHKLVLTYLFVSQNESIVCLLLALRAQHGECNHIPATFLPSFLDLVVWAHEHESRPEPEYHSADGEVGEMYDGEFGENGFYIYQPGSSVATSLCEGEVPPK